MTLSFPNEPLDSAAMNQNSREALIELLFLSLYMDDHLSLAEDNVLTEALDSLGWESESARENFIFRAFAASREAFTSLEKAQIFFAERADTIKRHGDEGAALTWLTRVLAADGLTSTEKYFLGRLEKYFYP
jgi:hypothetical protein